MVYQSFQELKLLSVGHTAIDDSDDNRLLWAPGGLACQLFHGLWSRLWGASCVAQPKRLRAWLFRMPGRWTTHGEQWHLDLPAVELTRSLFGRALSALRGPPRYAH